jgi:hypothetical protein
MNVQTATPATIDLATIKDRQHAAWGSGDYARIGTRSSAKCSTRPSISAAISASSMSPPATPMRLSRRPVDADVVSTDYVASLLDRGRERAQADRLPVTFQQADAENLPFAEASFDVVLSTFGAMFTLNQEKAASELIRSAVRARSASPIGLRQASSGGCSRP